MHFFIFFGGIYINYVSLVKKRENLCEAQKQK